MALQFFNTLSRRKEDFVPLDPAGKHVSLYTCGPTVYNFAHIGNFRTYVFEDLLRRYLEYKGFDVQHVMNITDVEDKIIEAVKREKQPLGELTARYTKTFFEDRDVLNIKPAHQYPRATDHMAEMFRMIEVLLSKGIAYRSEDGSIYYSIEKFPEYGRLAHIHVDELKPGERVKHDEYEKETVADFALWKAWDEADGEVKWDSPWGPGRPGWHLECSAMSIKYLGEQIDVHCGGVDNIFPHHQNEIAQSEPCTGKQFVKYWLHSAHLQVEGRKMSKSLGNFYTLRDLLAKGWTGREIRYALISTHYREQVNFTFDGLQAARSALQRMDEFLLKLDASPAGTVPDLQSRFDTAMDDDLNTSAALGTLFEFIREANKRMIPASEAAAILATWQRFDQVLGFGLPVKSEVPADVLALVEERQTARKARDFKRSDEIRDQLAKTGWAIEDTPKGPRAKRVGLVMATTKRYPPINPKCPHFLHGGDYNPEQWLQSPEVLKEDLRLMKLAHCNAMSVGIFSWSALEPEEGRFTFDWLDRVLDDMAKNGVFAVLATPSGARPAWMSQEYPEVLRVNADRVRILHGARHNHCYTSSVYREKTALINRKLAERYKDHPALLLWHLSNEYGGECHCPLCQDAFRAWLKLRYKSLDALNQAWWTAFWSHTYSDWSQIESPAPHGEWAVHGLSLDWKRFVTHQTTDFMKHEIAPLREITPNVPLTTNMMGTYAGLNYWKMAPELDVVSWDSYPAWHGQEEDWRLGSSVSFIHDIYRCLKGGRPFMLMESTPSATNWQEICKFKRPGMHRLSSLQAVAHGADTVQYFQWRKSRGSFEKFHGAVVDHVGHENTRVFHEVWGVGQTLEKLDGIIGTTVRPEVAIIYDWENEWAIGELQGLSRKRRDYGGTCVAQYRPFWSRGVPVDVIDMDSDFANYKLLIAPMLYMLRPGVAERIEKFVKKGGVFITTYWSGIVNESDLCFLGGFPGPLRKVLGIWSEEIDVLHDGQTNSVVSVAKNGMGLSGRYVARELCDHNHAETAQVLAKYGADFYKGRPALTVNAFGKGKAYYIASRNDDRFHDDFYGALISQLGLKPVLKAKLPKGVTAQLRTDGKYDFVFLLNFQPAIRKVNLGREAFTDMDSGQNVKGRMALPAYGSLVLRRPHVA